MALIKDHGPSNWVRISQMLATRTPKQCRERYHQNLKPTLNHEPITDQEGMYIEQLVAQYGKKWAEIARHLNGRSDNAVKNWWNGGANRRRRASLAMEQQQQHQQQQQQHQNQQPQHQAPVTGAISQPPPPIHHHAAPAPPPPPHSAAAGGPAYMHQFNYYPTVGHRVSLPNIHSEAYHHPPPPGHHHRPLAPSHLGPYASQHQPYSQPQFQPHAQQQQQQQQQPPTVVFNSAYTDGSGGAFGRSTASAFNSTVDPHQEPAAPTSPRPEAQPESNGSNTTNPNSTPSGSYFSSSRRRGTAHLDDMALFPNTPYSRRVSINTTSTGYSSSRASSIGGISSASDNEDPLHSLSKYSLSNSTTTSRRNSAIPPINNDIPTTLPPLGGTGNGGGSPNSSLFNPAYRQQQTPQQPQRHQPQSSTSPSLAPPQNYHRHSISGYPSSTPPGQSPTTGNFKLGGINEHASDSTTTPPPSSTSGSPDENNEPSPVISTKPAEEKLKISNLLS
ncbi:hypothetical protein TRVA0_006S01090 [Trichomonascus vanleenenianus]|uniref:SANT/Myb-like DNA-binding domain-containing protein n=1 Tax=Trichomonascus vanleenenianus TaxID=2268995 RepID=UPI003ECABAC7